MARDPGLEELVQASLRAQHGITGKAMFGGWAFLLQGHLLCAAGASGLMLRVGRENETWALQMPGVASVVMRGRHMHGWVRAAPETCADDAARECLVEAAVAFTRTLPRGKAEPRRGPRKAAAAKKRKRTNGTPTA